jgi:hypothetical protein
MGRRGHCGFTLPAAKLATAMGGGGDRGAEAVTHELAWECASPARTEFPTCPRFVARVGVARGSH